MTQKLRLYHWNARPNFGDALSPLILKHFAGIDTQWSTPGTSDIISTGSIIEHLPAYYTGVIIGAGRLGNGPNNLYSHTADILALRGPLTAAGVRGDYALGDPGLLAPELVGPQDRIHPLGVLPHWTDTQLAARFAQYHPFIIDPAWDPIRVIAAIGSCQKLATSSLHGIIVADSFGVPRRLEPTPTPDVGGTFKFRDYHESIGVDFSAAYGVTTRVPKANVDTRRNDIHDAMNQLREMHA